MVLATGFDFSIIFSTLLALVNRINKINKRDIKFVQKLDLFYWATKNDREILNQLV